MSGGTYITITKDDITPALQRMRKNIPKVTQKMVSEILKYGKNRTLVHLKNINDEKLRNGIHVQVMRGTPRGTIWVEAWNNGINYASWVNKDVPMVLKKPSKFFSNKPSNRIWYGSSTVRSPHTKLNPNGRKIKWDADYVGRKGFFDMAKDDMIKNMNKVIRKHQGEMLK